MTCAALKRVLRTGSLENTCRTHWPSHLCETISWACWGTPPPTGEHLPLSLFPDSSSQVCVPAPHRLQNCPWYFRAHTPPPPQDLPPSLSLSSVPFLSPSVFTVFFSRVSFRSRPPLPAFLHFGPCCGPWTLTRKPLPSAGCPQQGALAHSFLTWPVILR